MARVTSSEVEKLFESQFKVWDLARNNFEALKGVEVKEFKIGKSSVKVQFNPARIVSTSAKVDTKSLKERKCFLCGENRPAVQEGLKWGDKYTVLINPFPIFPRHLTIPCNSHVNQMILDRIADMMMIAQDLDKFTLFYNGPKCGASAPDHMHFQAGNKGFLSCETDVLKADKKLVKTVGKADLYKITDLFIPCFLIETKDINDGKAMFEALYAAIDIPEGEPEPMLNVLCWFEGDTWFVMVVPRKKHRPSCYFAEGDDQILLSPASVDMGGVFITPVEKDFRKISADDLQTIVNEVCLNTEDIEKIINRIK